MCLLPYGSLMTPFQSWRSKELANRRLESAFTKLHYCSHRFSWPTMGADASLKVTRLALRTHYRFLHQPGDTGRQPEALLVSRVSAYLPFTYTAISQIARSIPDDLMEVISSSGTHNGLFGFLLQHPKDFQCKHIGNVAVSRRCHSPTICVASRAAAAMPSTRNSFAAVVPPELAQQIPSFLIPISTLNNTNTGMSVEQTKALLTTYHNYINYVNPFSRQPATLLADLQRGDDVWLKGYVCCLARSHECGGESANSRHEASFVESYEWFRVARLFPESNRDIAVTPAMVANSVDLLPAGRSLLHVLLSAPQLFTVTVHSNPDSTLTPSSAPRAEVDLPPSPPPPPSTELPIWSVTCTFKLSEAYVVPLNESKESLFERINGCKAIREDTHHGIRLPIPRRRRRQWLRQLQYATCVTPFFDDRVLAQLLLDTLPKNGGVEMGALLRSLPSEARNCLPAQLSKLWNAYPHFFTVYHTDMHTCIQRADAPTPTIRPIDDITAEEVLMELFQRYPRRRHPELGTCFARSIVLLPRPLVDRLFRSRDVEEEFLTPFSDKVEVISLSLTETELGDLQRGCRGRTDFLVGFRFVGEWQERLINRFEAYCLKHHFDPQTTRIIDVNT